MRDVVGFFASPLSTVVGGILGGKGPPSLGPPVEINTETNRVSLPGAPLQGSARDRIFGTNTRYLAALQQAYDTGRSPGGEIYDRVAAEGRNARAGIYDQPAPVAPEQILEPEERSSSVVSSAGQQGSPIGPEDFFMPRFTRSIPGGYAGFAQQTPAGQRQMMGGKGPTTRRRRKKKRAAGSSARRRSARTSAAVRARRKASTTPKRRGRLVKGSAAAKAYMAKIRRKRKR